MRVCDIPGCGRPLLARGMCGTHYGRWRKYGDPLYTQSGNSEIISKRTESKIVVFDSHAEVELTKGKTAMIDLDILDSVSGKAWCATGPGYAICNGTYMHHLILPAVPECVVDHINRNHADNRRINLRYATYEQNMLNSNVISETKGYKKGKTGGYWAQITLLGKTYSAGSFAKEQEAKAARVELVRIREEHPTIFEFELALRNSGLRCPTLNR